MLSKKILAPKFISDYDDKLLKKHPETWSTRIIPALYYSVLAIIVLAAICFVAPNDLRSRNNIWNWIPFTIIISLVGLILWIIYLLRFNVFKRFGITSGGNRLKVFVLYFIIVGLIVSINFIPLTIQTIRANNAYTKEELINDADSLNLKISLLENKLLDTVWVRGLVIKVPDDELLRSYESDTIAISRKDSSGFEYEKKSSDSIIAMNDTSFYQLTAPDYTFIDLDSDVYENYSDEPYKGHKALSNKQLFYLVQQKKHTINTSTLYNDIQNLKQKYYYYQDYYYNDYGIDSEEVSKRDIYSRYEIPSLNRSFDNIIEKKTDAIQAVPYLFRTWLYASIFLTLLVFIFRHSTAKTFFLSLLAIVLLMLLTGLTMALSYSNNEGEQVLVMMLLYFVTFAIVSLTVFSSKRKNVFTGISINIFTLSVYFVPMIIAGIIIKSQSRKYYYDYNQDYLKYNYLMYWAEYVGAALLLILIPTLIHKMYKRWYALPEA